MEYIFLCMTVGEALKKWLEWKGKEWNQKRLARESGLSENTISSIKNEKTEPDTGTIRKIAKALGITVAQFWMGPEQRIDHTTPPDSLEPGRIHVHKPGESEFVRIPYAHKPMHPLGGEEVWVPHYKLKFAMGGGTVGVEPEEMELLPFKSEWVRKVLRANPSRLAFVDVIGDSMEPTLYEGDTVLVDREQTDLRRDGIYVFRVGDDLLIKRTERRMGKIIVISDNRLYESYPLDETDVEVFGRVLWKAGMVR